MRLGGFDTTSQVDAHGWSALHHAVDASSYCSRAVSACEQLIPQTPAHIINSGTLGSQPRGWTCLHFACDGSDKLYCRNDIVKELLDAKALLEERASGTGNTPFLLAVASGITDVAQTLIQAKADVHAKSERGQGALEKATHSSGTMKRVLQGHQI
jgi:hypothetical protein